ncbi:hypothetical protein QQF64_018749 [Cirrhinus molitorella]|uniref:Uncharacterized protein n=1 Tax=Cirrhinus molitorella TaxID=172907 RepID=A0ABR3LHI4_9TELE
MGQRGTKVSPMTVGEVYEHHLSTPPKPSTNMTVQHPQPQRGKCGSCVRSGESEGVQWAGCGRSGAVLAPPSLSLALRSHVLAFNLACCGSAAFCHSI